MYYVKREILAFHYGINNVKNTLLAADLIGFALIILLCHRAFMFPGK